MSVLLQWRGTTESWPESQQQSSRLSWRRLTVCCNLSSSHAKVVILSCNILQYLIPLTAQTSPCFCLTISKYLSTSLLPCAELQTRTYKIQQASLHARSMPWTNGSKAAKKEETRPVGGWMLWAWAWDNLSSRRWPLACVSVPLCHGTTHQIPLVFLWHIGYSNTYALSHCMILWVHF